MEKLENLKTNRRQFLKASGAGAMSLMAGPALAKAAEQTTPRPNIIIVMADDMGFSDAGCFGGEVDTPNIDRLAANGLRFNQFYNCSRCCPTRASLLTGLYPHQVGLIRNGRSITRDGMTIAEALKQNGYNTAMAGKWHLSQTPVLDDAKLHQKWLDHQHDPQRSFGPIDSYPVSRGFDRHYGIIWGVIDYFDPFSLVDGLEPVKSVPKDYYFTDAISEKAVEYVRDFARSPDRPFFLYLAHAAPHWPLHARPEDIAKYKDKYAGGWDKLRRERFARQLEMGLFDKENTPLPPVMDSGKTWDELTASERQFQTDKMAVHAAMIDRLDQGLGNLLKTLEETNQLENTVIFFLSDNGASPETPQGPGYDRTAQTRDGREVRYNGPYKPGDETTYCGIGQAWANAANTPFRYWKKESFEGGCHTPMIVHWPRGLKTKPGAIADRTGHVMDIMPTCLELAGARYPAQYDGHALAPLEGKSLTPTLEGGSKTERGTLCFEHEGGRAVRQGDWKIVALKGKPWELYNMARDRTETENLAASFPGRVETMKTAWDNWAKRVKIPPQK